MRSLTAILGTTALLAAVAAVNPITAGAANAVSGSDFKADLIISNEVMYYPGAMSAAGIQAFLNAKGGTCAAGYTCLKDYTMTTTDKPADSFCNGYIGKTAESSAQIIYKAARSCGVNPQVLLVLLQKEQSLITRTSPNYLTYRAATGYGCPDTAACSSTYYGFFNQVWLAAKSFKRTPTGRYTVGVPTTVLYAPKSTCGVKYLTIKNKATARLYVYTPYTPDKAALSNLYGLGDKCSTYGNRNFWRLFNDWFGSSVLPASSLSFVHSLYTDVLARDATSSELYNKSRGITLGPARAARAKATFVSTEYRNAFVNDLFTQILGRPATPTEVATWVQKLAAGTVPQDSMAATVISFTSFYRTQSGGTPEGYVGAVYQQILQRVPTAEELAKGLASLTKLGRKNFALSIWKGPEHNAQRVDAAYRLYLARAASPTEQASGASSIAKNSYYNWIAAVLGSSEYLSRAQRIFPAVG